MQPVLSALNFALEYIKKGLLWYTLIVRVMKKTRKCRVLAKRLEVMLSLVVRIVLLGCKGLNI